GEIQFVSWDDNAKVLSWINGVIPMPEDYRSSFKMDFITYDGDPHDPVAPSTNWSYIGENTWDGHQMFFATPLSKIQMAKLGFDTTLTAITPGGQLPDGFVLKQNYPNPFNPSTTIEFQLPEAATVTLKVYNVVGAEVASMLQGQRMNAGLHRFTFDGSRLSSGVYLYQLSTASYKATRKMVLIR
ncbi:MAG: T9SS type A sorting domain-containing protein, partial [Calditrichaeota bacterium]|nr:T9SS type A sorting domain-containing protein [Calditrichota bacterium]